MSPSVRFAALTLWLIASAGWAGSAKVLMYHHVSDATPAATSVTPATFDTHLAHLEEAGYEVVPLQRIVDTLLAQGELDSRWVAITFDDAYESVAQEAAPRLNALGWPFTVFVSTDFVDQGHRHYLTWDELRELETSGATLANHTLSHRHMVRRQPEEPLEVWQDRLTREVIGAQERLEAELKRPLRLFAYPYGEFDEPVVSLMQSLGFIAFGQQSGPVGRTSNPYALPRFPLATGFDSVRTLAEKLRTEHLPLLDPPVPGTLLSADAGAPALTLRTEGPVVRPGSMTCFIAGQPAAEVTWQDDIQFRVRGEKPFRAGRTKYTCTAPHLTIPRAYYWHSHLYIKPRADGSWHED